MRVAVKPRWYGGKPRPGERARERKLLRAYHERLEERRRAGLRPEGFMPKEGPYAELYRREVGIIKKRIRAGDTVLDVGAGYGRLVEAALERGAGRVIALEPDSFAIRELTSRFGTDRRVSIAGGFAQDMSFLEDSSVDVVTFIGNSLGMMWKVVGDWEELVCQQKEALMEMLRVARREVAFIVYGKATLESSLKAYEPLQRNVVDIQDGLMLIEEREDKPYSISDEGKEIDRFVFQKFDREYLENLLADVGLPGYMIEGVPDGKGYGYLVVIPKE